MSDTVSPQQRHTKMHPCPICDGYDTMPRGEGVRCGGYTSEDGMYVFCQRVESDSWNDNAQAWVHRILEPPKLVPKYRVATAEDANVIEDSANVLAEYIYRDEYGEPLYKTLRAKPKRFWQARHVGDKWYRGLADSRLVPYRLPEILAHPDAPILIVEGEKDADALATFGFVATTNAMGAGKWRAEYNHWFKGREVYIIPDNDDVGYKHGVQVEKELATVAKSVAKIPIGAGMASGSDVSDWLAGGHNADELEELLLAAARLHEKRYGGIVGPLNGLQLHAMSFPPVKWVVDGIFPEGLTILGGKAKMGKSWLLLDVVLAVANGSLTLGDRKTIAGRAIYFALEDNWRRLYQRTETLYRNGAHSPSANFETDIVLPRLSDGGLLRIQEYAEAHEDLRIAVVDTYAKVRDEPGRTSKGANPYHEDYASVQGLKDIADAYGIAIVLVHHLRKMDSEDPFDLFSGTTGLTGGVDNMAVLKRQRGSEDAILHIAGRDQIQDQELAMKWDPLRATWVIEGDASVVMLAKEKKDIIDVLNDADEALFPKDIASLLGKEDQTGRNAVKQRLHRMEQEGLLWTANGKYTVRHEAAMRIPNNRVTVSPAPTLAHQDRPKVGDKPLSPLVTAVTGLGDKVTPVTPVTPVTKNGHKPLSRADEWVRANREREERETRNAHID